MRVIVTAGNSGVAKATAGAPAAAGNRVVIACRKVGKAEQAAADRRGKPATRRRRVGCGSFPRSSTPEWQPETLARAIADIVATRPDGHVHEIVIRQR
jgi:NAD(P)-dependent dehydrogenase (short-subunit alcohol dehydrogenase family)